MRVRMAHSQRAKQRIDCSGCRSCRTALRHLAHEGRVLEGGFRPGGLHREWCDAEMLRLIRRKSLAKLRREVEPVEQHTLARFLTHWQGLLSPRRSGHGHLDALLDAIESLQAPAARIVAGVSNSSGAYCEFASAGLDTLIAAGEVAWAGVEPIGERDGALHCSSLKKLPLLMQQRPMIEPLTEAKGNCSPCLSPPAQVSSMRCIRPWEADFRRDIDALWSLVWRGLITNDSLHALRAYIAKPTARAHPAACKRCGLSFAQNHAANRAGPLVASVRFVRKREVRAQGHPRPRQPRAGFATAQSLWRPDAGIGRRGKCARRFQRRLRCAQSS